MGGLNWRVAGACQFGPPTPLPNGGWAALTSCCCHRGVESSASIRAGASAPSRVH
jgi:hypothetical protein